MIYTHIAVGETYSAIYTATPFGTATAAVVGESLYIVFDDDTGGLDLYYE